MGPSVEKPNKEAYEAEMQAIQDKMTKLQGKQKEYAEYMSSKSHGKDEYFDTRSKLRAQLDEFSKQMNELADKKAQIQGQTDSKRQEGRQMRDDLNKLKKSIGYTDEGQIDSRIADIEFKLWTDTIPLKEEKKLLAEIQELKRN